MRQTETMQHKAWKLHPVCYRTLHGSECLNCREFYYIIPNYRVLYSGQSQVFHRNIECTKTHGTVGSLEVRASDSRLEGLGSMPDVIKCPSSTWSTRSLNLGAPKSCGRSQQKPRVQGAGEYFPPLLFQA
ncbi:hypothetical protein TNCV_295161 [Trichonephila clavipes]|nr:hypothetical protein TNCV_295161 [Trichonephila clavipes]